MQKKWITLCKRRQKKIEQSGYVWEVYCRGRNEKIATLLLVMRFMIYMLIGIYAAFGFATALMMEGLTSNILVIPFLIVWKFAQPLCGAVFLGALVACGHHVYARVGAKMARNQPPAEGAQ